MALEAGEWITTTMAGITLLVVGWAALKLVSVVGLLHGKVDKQGERLARIEGRLGDGIAKDLSQIGSLKTEIHGLRGDFRRFIDKFKDHVDKFTDHADHEEERILEVWRAEKEKT